MGIVNKKDYDVYEDESGGLIYTPKEKLKEREKHEKSYNDLGN
jgi:hypothetical protein